MDTAREMFGDEYIRAIYDYITRDVARNLNLAVPKFYYEGE